MREILFRGKRIDNGERVEGDLLRSRGKCYIHMNLDPFDYLGELSGFIKMYEVDPETVCEFTGLTDENGTKIFEGDIIKTWTNRVGKIEFGQYWDDELEVDFYGYAWKGKDEYGESIILALNECWEGHIVIGNIHDNPELLKGDKQ